MKKRTLSWFSTVILFGVFACFGENCRFAALSTPNPNFMLEEKSRFLLLLLVIQSERMQSAELNDFLFAFRNKEKFLFKIHSIMEAFIRKLLSVF